MNTNKLLDLIQLWEKIRIPNNDDYRAINSFRNCEFRFVHESDYWPDEFRHTIPFHDWPRDGSDYAIVIGMASNQFKSIRMNEVDYIHSIDNQTMIINTIKIEFIIEFSNKNHMKSFFELIYQKIPCYYWDLIITNMDKNIYCLLNRNFIKLYQQNNNNDQSEEDEDDNIIVHLPPSIPPIGGQSSSKSVSTVDIPPPPPPSPPKVTITKIEKDNNEMEEPFWDEDEINEIVFGDDF